MSKNERMVTEIPSSLKQLARLVVRGFYTIEDALVIDMLVRNPCMKEDDICELLRFERKQLRSRITILKNDKFIQVRLKMETGADGKAQKVNYYFINYKTFVNVVKYKLDLMRKRMETEERDATSRASFKCPNCNKTFTDLEADQLFDFTTNEFHCTFCGQTVEEDLSALPKKDSRLMLARFNEQLQVLYDLLREVEEIKLSPECLEPEPVDIDTIRGIIKGKQGGLSSDVQWSGEATRGGGFAAEETRVDISIGETDSSANTVVRKDRPVWMTESTVITNDGVAADNGADDVLERAAHNSQQLNQLATASSSSSTSSGRNKKEDDIMSVLLQHEKQAGHQNNNNRVSNAVKGLQSRDSSDSDNDEIDPDEIDNQEVPNAEEFIDSESDDDGPTVMVAGRPHSINDINDNLIALMSPQEKDTYIQIYQEHFSHMYD